MLSLRRSETAAEEQRTTMSGAPAADGSPAANRVEREPLDERDSSETAPRAGTPLRRERLGSRRARRRSMGSRTRNAGAAAVGAVGTGVIMVARLVMAVATLIALLIALAIVLRDVGANGQNTIVKGIHEGGNFFAGSFTGLISFSGHPKRAITVDWGIAAIVYLVVGALIAGYIRRIGSRGLGFGRRHRTATL